MILTPAQNTIAGDTHRFRVLNCGRRFGKTTLALEEMLGVALAGNDRRITYYAPTRDDARDIMWAALCRAAAPAITYKNEARLELRVRTIKGGESLILLYGWEAVQERGKGRGVANDFIVLDEVAQFRNFWLGWDEVLSPTLIDKQGQALFISTPKGFNHFYELYNFQEKNPDYKSFHYTSYDNPHIKAEEIEREKRSKPENAFAQEYLADFRKAEGLVYPEFDRAKHVYSDVPEGTGFIETVAGVDFGFIHPCAVEPARIDRAGGLWLEGEFYETHRTDIEVAEYVAALNINRVFPDPESPSAIEELRRHGVNVRPVVKGRDSEKHGIDKVRELLKAGKLHIHHSCKGLINEFETHAYKEGKDDPEEEGEDALDALRYMVMMLQPASQREEPEYVEPEPLYSDIGL